MLQELVAAAPIFALVAIRAIAMIETAPLLSSEANPQMVRIALGGFAAFCAMGSAPVEAWTAAMGDYGPFSLVFLALAAGEALIGIIMGFFLSVVFSSFASAGQFFSLQMGFGASETYDPLAQIENPLMGQYLNLIAMMVFVTMGGFRQAFLGGFFRSLQSISAPMLYLAREEFLKLFLSGLTNLFLDALVISLPILGTLFLVSVTIGLLSKAAPQMNLLTEGFPISITVAFTLIMVTMPFLVEAFARVIIGGFQSIHDILARVGSGI